MHLLHENIEVRELLLVADLRDELHFQLAPIERTGVIEYMSLEQRLGAIHRGPEPEARDAGMWRMRVSTLDAAHAYRVDAGERQLAAAHADIRRRVTQPATELLTPHDAPEHRVRTA